MRPDWRELLEGVAAAGTRTLWVAFHGVGADHDAIVHRPGAFEETCEAVRRIRAMGFRCGANIFVSRPLLARLPELLQALDALALDEEGWELPGFYPNARQRRHEALRPTLAEVAPHAATIAARSAFWKGEWGAPAAYTEARWRERALAGEWGVNELWTGRRQIELVVRPNLDVYTGLAGLYRERHGNLRRDDAGAVFERALAHGRRSNDELHLGASATIPLAELAERVGDPQGQTIDLYPYSVRHRWLQKARSIEHRT
jgi:MoaA/NifB/PqqE/SkfB family radical SAM enzyme